MKKIVLFVLLVISCSLFSEIVKIDSIYIGNMESGSDTQNHYTALGKIDEDHLLLYYRENITDDGILKTFELDASYNITMLDSLWFETYAIDGEFLMIDETHFLHAYCGSGADGFVVSYSLDASYNITAIDTLEFDTVYGRSSGICFLDSTHFMIGYQGDGSDGFIASFSMDVDGDNLTLIDTEEHHTAGAYYNQIVRYDDTHVVLYHDYYDGNMEVFSVDGSYIITAGDLLNVDHTSVAKHPDLDINGNNIILWSHGYGDYFLTTYKLNGSYQLSAIDTLTVTTSTVKWLSSDFINDNHIVTACGYGPTTGGYIKTIKIDNDGYMEANEALIHTSTGTYAAFNSVTAIDETHVALVCLQDSNLAYLKVFEIGAYSLSPEIAVPTIDHIDGFFIGE